MFMLSWLPSMEGQYYNGQQHKGAYGAPYVPKSQKTFGHGINNRYQQDITRAKVHPSYQYPSYPSNLPWQQVPRAPTQAPYSQHNIQSSNVGKTFAPLANHVLGDSLTDTLALALDTQNLGSALMNMENFWEKKPSYHKQVDNLKTATDPYHVQSGSVKTFPDIQSTSLEHQSGSLIHQNPGGYNSLKDPYQQYKSYSPKAQSTSQDTRENDRYDTNSNYPYPYQYDYPSDQNDRSPYPNHKSAAPRNSGSSPMSTNMGQHKLNNGVYLSQAEAPMVPFLQKDNRGSENHLYEKPYSEQSLSDLKSEYSQHLKAESLTQNSQNEQEVNDIYDNSYDWYNQPVFKNGGYGSQIALTNPSYTARNENQDLGNYKFDGSSTSQQTDKSFEYSKALQDMSQGNQISYKHQNPSDYQDLNDLTSVFDNILGFQDMLSSQLNSNIQHVSQTGNQVPSRVISNQNNAGPTVAYNLNPTHAPNYRVPSRQYSYTNIPVLSTVPPRIQSPYQKPQSQVKPILSHTSRNEPLNYAFVQSSRANLRNYTVTDGSAVYAKSSRDGIFTEYGKSKVLVKYVKVPVYIKKKVYVKNKKRRKTPKKDKMISEMKGFYVEGGVQYRHKVVSLWSCRAACERTPFCFAGDYSSHDNTCYFHTYQTACGVLRAKKLLTHFKKVPCSLPEITEAEGEAELNLGRQYFRGIEHSYINSFQECLKKCSTAGLGVSSTFADRSCMGLDYDFSTHRCYIFGRTEHICDDATAKMAENPNVINIRFCQP